MTINTPDDKEAVDCLYYFLYKLGIYKEVGITSASPAFLKILTHQWDLIEAKHGLTRGRRTY